MTYTIIATRTSPEDSPPSTIRLQSRKKLSSLKEVKALLAPSLSGPITDYEINWNPPHTLLIAAKISYKDMGAKMREDLIKITNEKRLLEDQQAVLRRHQLYTTMYRALDGSHAYLIPSWLVKRTPLLIDLPYALAHWCIQWNRDSPAENPFPKALLHFGPITFDYTDAEIFIRDPRTGKPSRASKDIQRAWKILDESTRELMLFCWCARYKLQDVRNAVAHPELEKEYARAILGTDLRGDPTLQDAACRMSDRLFH